ncbi:MAG: ELM1/GtrOC1 family putative glycosyltransferase [Hyphomicrobiaceae bacterium]|nr:ELM1/GtrOC1 family putative glycosyltransferase [Hyphomicrobiaceae bacterium]
MPPITALLISDGRPGHYMLAEGIIAAIARRREVITHRLDVTRSRLLPGRLLALVTNARWPAHHLLANTYGIEPATLGRPDVIVSAGGETLAANILAARLTGAANLFYGSLRTYRPRDFTLVMTSYASQVDAPNRLMTLKPSPLDPDALSDGPPPATAGATPRTAGLILGGPAGRTARFSPEDWDGLVRLVDTTHAAWGTRWIIANAPRTPPAVSDRIAGLAAQGWTALAEFVDFRTAGPGTLARVIGPAEVVLVTADSSTMLSETVWLRRPVVAVAPARCGLPANERAYRDYLRTNHWSADIAIADLDPDRLRASLTALQPLSGNPLDRLATELTPHLPGLMATR